MSPCEVAAGVQDHPRIRGEHFFHLLMTRISEGSSPHTRGARSISIRRPGRSRDHPRIRGEHLRDTIIDAQQRGSSPHTRGARLHVLSLGAGPGIIPAYAGSTAQYRNIVKWQKDHPRIRGEHRQRADRRLRGQGSSPHTRGARPDPPRDPRGPGIIPAYAGSTPTPTWSKRASWDHPRIRGEHNTDAQSEAFSTGSSPHTRGARRRPEQPALERGIIPAYAGSTDFFGDAFAAIGDHPRIRGEHRGAGSVVSARRRIIPAYAGSTVSKPISR